jgi:hypothetical protein
MTARSWLADTLTLILALVAAAEVVVALYLVMGAR